VLNDDSRNNLNHYFAEQLFPGILGQRENVGSKLAQLNFFYKIFLEILPMIGASLLIILFSTKKNWISKVTDKHMKYGVFFFLTGIAASVPIVFSAKQMLFYIVPSISFFALGLGSLVVVFAKRITGGIMDNTRLNKVVSLIMLMTVITCIAIASARFGSIGRDRELFSDLSTLKEFLPRNSTIGTCNSDWKLLAYLARYYHTSTDCKSGGLDIYLLKKKCKKILPDEYIKIEKETVGLDLFIKSL
jgi:hypothetical protein